MFEEFAFPAVPAQSAPLGLDEIDRQIITLLLRDGRTPAAALARSVVVSQCTVRYRIERLQRLGVITFGAVLNPHALGLDVLADIFMEVAPGQVRTVAQRFAARAEVSYVAGSIGNGDLSIQVCLPDSGALLRFVDEVVGQMPGVTQARTVLVPWKLKDVREWDIPSSLATQSPTTLDHNKERKVCE